MKRILAAVDISTTAPLIVSQAVDLARAIGAKVRLFHVVTVAPQVPPPGVFAPPVTIRVNELVRTAEEALRELQASIPEELRDGILVEVGLAPDRVCDLARSYDADVVVIGAHEYGLLARALGTTAARIVNRLDRPAFVVRPMPPGHVVSPEPARPPPR
jgi:nucleotide-binding universal stress UspA family protein